MKNNDPIFWPSADIDESIRQSMQKNYTDCINVLQTQWYQADVDQRFIMADQDIWGLIFPGVATYRRKIFNFNIINPIVQAISGHQRQTRKSTICIPIKGGSQKTADQLTKCLYHVHKNGVYQTYSDAFEQGALTSGLGFVSIYKDLTDDPISGDIKTRYIDMKSCLFDPFMRKHDMSDCRFFWTRTFYGRDEAALIHPDLSDDIMALPSGTYRDDKFYYMPEVYQIQFPNLIAMDEYWYLSSREATYLVQKDTEECQEWKGDEEQLRDVMQQFPGVFSVIKRKRPTVRRSIIVNDRVMLDEPNPYGIDRYPVVPFLGYFTPDTPYYAYKFRGIVRDMRDAQYLFNRLKVSNLDILEAQQQGLKVRQGSLVTPEDGLNAGHGRILTYKKDASPLDIEQMQIQPPSPVMLQMEEMLMNITHRIAGVDPSAMGIDVDDKAGIISMMRQVATARNLQRLFDQFDESQRLCGEIMVEMIQKDWTWGKVKQVCGEDPTDEFDSKLFAKYNSKIVQGALTETQQQLELAQLLSAREILGDLIDPKVLLEAMTLQNKDKLLESVAQREQAQQQQQQQMAEAQMKQIEVDNATKIGYAKAEEALAQERLAKIQSDIAVAEEKIRKSHQEDTQSLLNVAKILKELQTLDMEHLKGKIETLHMINNLDFDPQGSEMARQEHAASLKTKQTPQGV
ncbi:MAG: hypothetical protein A3F13_02715 [Gammaproteobacteria bacterium RIFCSPHIGHO2_12_FULL_40_19]|nr:MAG: hypothetical protein A3F13_02715 [Gammaproteobacteria bacterium RIFCSPHIGHO2_12_FULL_40_19]